jgi:hypothetical protein
MRQGYPTTYDSGVKQQRSYKMSHERGDYRQDRRDDYNRGGCHDSGDRFRQEANCYPQRQPVRHREVHIYEDDYGYGRGGRGGGNYGRGGCDERFGGIPPIPRIQPIGGCFPEFGGFRPPVIMPPVLLPPVMIGPRQGGCWEPRGGCYEPQPIYQPQPIYRSGGYYSNDEVYGGRDGYRSSRQRYDGGSYYQQPQVYYEPQPRYDYRQPDYGYQQGPRYSNDDVYGGRDGYRSSRQRYDGGSSGYNGGYDTGLGQTGQVFDFALKGFDAWAGYDIARRYTRR